MTRSISSVLLEAARHEYVYSVIGEIMPCGFEGAKVFLFIYSYLHDDESLSSFTFEERSAFLYICSLIAEDEHG